MGIRGQRAILSLPLYSNKKKTSFGKERSLLSCRLRAIPLKNKQTQKPEIKHPPHGTNREPAWSVHTPPRRPARSRCWAAAPLRGSKTRLLPQRESLRPPRPLWDDRPWCFLETRSPHPRLPASVSHPAFRVRRCSARQASPLGVADSARGIEMPGRRVISPRVDICRGSEGCCGQRGLAPLFSVPWGSWARARRCGLGRSRNFPNRTGAGPGSAESSAQLDSENLDFNGIDVYGSERRRAVFPPFLCTFQLRFTFSIIFVLVSGAQHNPTLYKVSPPPDISSPRPAPHTLLQYHRLHALCCAYIPVTTLSLPTCASRSLHFFTQLPSLPPGPYL